MGGELVMHRPASPGVSCLQGKNPTVCRVQNPTLLDEVGSTPMGCGRGHLPYRTDINAHFANKLTPCTQPCLSINNIFLAPGGHSFICQGPS